MMRALATAVLGAILTASCGGSSSAPTATPTPTPPVSTPTALDATSFEGLVLASGRPCLVEFYLPTCSACQAMTPVVAQLATDFAGRAVVGTVDASVQPTLASAYAVHYVPTFIFFHHGREVSRQVGTTRYEDLAAKLNALVVAP